MKTPRNLIFVKQKSENFNNKPSVALFYLFRIKYIAKNIFGIMKTYSYLLDVIEKKGAAYLILIDPDKISGERLNSFVSICEKAGVDGFLIGGSLLMSGNLEEAIDIIKKISSLPAIIFPGAVHQLYKNADAVLYISLISGRNADHIIGKHIIAAPIIKRMELEPISTGYMLIESGAKTTAEYISGSLPIPRNKPEIAVATALAGQFLGMKFIYLEGGSGAQQSVPKEMVFAVSNAVDVPIIVGGGIRTPQEAREKVKSGAKVVVTGNFFEDDKNWELLKEFADAIHKKGI